MGFIDKRYEKMTEYCHLPVFSLPKALIKFGENLPILISIHNRDVNMVEVINEIKKTGFKQVFTMFDYVNNFPDDDTFRFFLTPTKKLVQHSHEAERFFNLLSDDKSKEIYHKLIQFRLSGNYLDCPLPEPERQYSPHDIPRWPQSLRLMDCGAYNGDSIKLFQQYGYQLEEVIAFEPDHENYVQLIKNCHDFPVSSIPCGIASQVSQARFSTGNGEGSRSSSEGSTMVQMISIDQAFPNWSPNLIKMDIEGGEFDAIKGANDTIKKYSPGLAISAYHLPQDLWKLGLLIDSVNPNYNFYLRSHAYSSFDTVLYAIPL